MSSSKRWVSGLVVGSAVAGLSLVASAPANAISGVKCPTKGVSIVAATRENCFAGTNGAADVDLGGEDGIYVTSVVNYGYSNYYVDYPDQNVDSQQDYYANGVEYYYQVGNDGNNVYSAVIQNGN
jgi:hypothetical protein